MAVRLGWHGRGGRDHRQRHCPETRRFDRFQRINTSSQGSPAGAAKDSSGSAFSRTLKGVAPNVNLINLRVLDRNGIGQEADVISAIQRAIDLKNTYNIRVINLSLGRPVFESYALDPLCQAVKAAWKAGIVVVVAAGNYGRDNSMLTQGYGTIAAPGND